MNKQNSNNNVSRNTDNNNINKNNNNNKKNINKYINNNNNNKNNKRINNDKNENKGNHDTNNTPFRILAHNVQGLNSPAKHAQIILTMKQNDIAIMGLSETTLQNKNSKFLYKNNTEYDAFFDNSSDHPNGSGVGLIISKQFSKHIHKIESFKGRLISADMFFKGHIKIRIIQIYIHANTTQREEIEELYTKITNIIEDAQRKNFKLIVMGDFNVCPEKYKKHYRSTGNIHWRYKILHMLEIKNLIDIVDLYQDITLQNPCNTFSNHNFSSRIDLIFISRDLIMETINANNHNIDFYTSDHLAVYVSFINNNIFNKKSFARNKQQKIRKRIFNYDKMNEEKWLKFQEATNLLPDIVEINCQQDLSSAWITFRSFIYSMAIKYIDNRLIPTTSIDHRPKFIKRSNNEMSHINKILRQLRPRNINNHDNFKNFSKKWSRQLEKLDTIMHNNSITDINFPITFTHSNIEDIRKNIRSLLKIISMKFDMTVKRYNDKQIKKFVQKRCEDYKSDQGNMINSLMSKSQRRIIIDRLIYKENDQKILITDPNKIKELTNKHFQTCLGAINEEKEIPDPWKHQYEP